MVLQKIRDALSPSEEKYEALYYKYSKLKLENQKLKEQHMQEMKEHKEGVQRKVADNLIAMYEDIETMKNDSYKVKVNDKEMQRLLVDINKVDKSMKGIMKQFSLEEVEPSERYYDPELHDVASYEDAKGMAKGIILRTAKRGFKYRGELIRKPRVIVTK